MSKDGKTWSILGLAIVIIILVLVLLKRKHVTTQTNVSIPGAGQDLTQFPTRNEMNEVLLRICHYDNGHQLSLNPQAVGGSACPPVFTAIDGSTGYLVKDEVIVVPQAGAATGPGAALGGA